MTGTPIEQSNSNDVRKDLEVEDPQNVQREETTPSTREITQNDRLNKKLLVSFLNRINSQAGNNHYFNNNSDEEDDSDANFD
jgi:hypothetical protein